MPWSLWTRRGLGRSLVFFLLVFQFLAAMFCQGPQGVAVRSPLESGAVLARIHLLQQARGESNLHCSWHVFSFFSYFLVLFIFTGGLQKTKFFATIPRVEMKRPGRHLKAMIGIMSGAAATQSAMSGTKNDKVEHQETNARPCLRSCSSRHPSF